jgi:osmotically inducible protein OsmC
MKELYATSAKSSGGRNGRAELTDGTLAFDMSFPKSLGGSGKGQNPEQLFAMGYSACFNQAILVVGGKHKVNVQNAEVTVKVTLNQTDQGGFALAVDLSVALPGIAPDEARKIVEEAHQICPYSNATRNNIPVSLSVA